MPNRKDSDASSADDTDSEPETELWSPDTMTADSDDYISDAEPGVASDWSNEDLGNLM